ncbi:pentapeptide repeat-containing protein [Limnoraphis robusta CCNP1315]|uniref:Pentapeptide repeat-containing protein n=1 Tax=Limnoraphis robusta CCNP1315 TaxID=3110306 RepID=A0ABU5TVA4_9CYAN|nr:pentapeptide repeat-containing protein [Limnoraphis robusta]MEA5518478.1 pentapeptide repeat-containing protein [Limnoraphis robusta CCNP1315]MEA5545270.1 pentapeptide repeat-containing protein [Limnoraphis robusta CCNP1324]
MAGKLWRKIWTVLNTDIELSLTGTVSAGVEGGKAVFELAKALQENKNAKELAPIIENFDSLLDVLNSPLGKVAGTALPFLPIATGILTYIAEQTRSEPSLADSVQLVSEVAYLESLRQFLPVFLKEHPKLELAENTASSQLAKKIKKLGETLEVDGKEINFDDQEARKTLICFHDSPLAKVFNAILVERFQESGLDKNNAKITTERISRNTHRYMKEAVAEVRDSAKKLAGIYGDGWLKDIETYHSIDQYLKEVIATKPEEKVFDEKFNFRQIYVPMNVKPVKSDGEVIESSDPENIEYWAKTTLLDDSKKDQVLFIQGGPGRGKSVFCRMFSDWVRRELDPIYTPILIRLRDIKSFSNDINETLATVIDRDFTRIDSGWLTDSNTRFLFLLDGFDELLLERGKGNDLKFFLDQVADFQKRCSKNNEQGHRVLITGRPLALYGIERLMPTNLERVEIIPMDDTIQQQWLEKWKTVVNSDPTIAETKTDNFWQFLQDERCPQQAKDLAKEPLLLYLLAALHRDSKFYTNMFENADAGEAKIIIYEQALEWVLNKQRTDKYRGNLNEKLTRLEPGDLRSLLAEAGLCVVQSGREYASIKMIESRLLEKEDEGAKELIEKARQTGSDEALKNALAAFYLKSGKADNSVEFFHKSFGEFLCAERMAETLEEFTFKSKKRGKTYEIPTKELEWEIYDLFGYGNLTAEIVQYLMALLIKKDIDFAVLFERLHEFYLRWCNGDFIELWDATEEMLPLKKAKQLQQQDIERGQRQVDIYTGLNVMILLFELHRYGQSKEELKEKLHFHPCGQRGSEEFDEERLLKIIGYADSLNLYAFSSIVGQFLSGADLSGAYLIRADLSGAYLIRADLIRADLIRANLIRADLRSADLRSADLSGADLIRADLRSANLRSADLSGAYLRSADLSGANLGGADLRSADLSGADLSDIRWDNDTKWSNVVGLEEAYNVPEELKQQSGI